MRVHRSLQPVWRLSFMLVCVLMGFSSFPHRSAQARTALVAPQVRQQVTQGNKATFWVILREEADLRPAYAIKNWEARGRFVVNKLQAVANTSQAELRRLLRSRNADHRPVWIVNALQVTADQSILNELAARPEVAKIVADGAYRIPEPAVGVEQPRVQSVEWNIDRIRAPQVWTNYGVRGEGIVVANIDTGVQFNHPALVNQYRGNLGGGTFDHNYNWFDPSHICGNPSLIPCDNNSHGTHTMGTIVGDDGGANQIGVAPGAKWIAAKGCETNSCSFGALVASGQWMLAPTDLNGQNASPGLRPQIINNSWGSGPGDTFYQSIVRSWVASGIFPAFSNGNSGPSCGSAGSPGDYPESYSAGAFDSSNAIASFSSRGASAVGGITKPNIAAPGVNVRSSVPGGGYAAFDGTSMASPHVAGAVALLWSRSPKLFGEVNTTRGLLDVSAIDTYDLSCGGTYGFNNVWGEGRLDVFAAMTYAPADPRGVLEGTVTNASGGAPVGGATVQVAGPATQTAITDGAGHYILVLPSGYYTISVSAFGYVNQTVKNVYVDGDGSTIQNIALVSLPRYTITGAVRTSSGTGIANAVVTIKNTSIPPVQTNASGAYSFANVPEGIYDIEAVGPCYDPQTQHSVIDTSKTLNFALAQRQDTFGYRCQATAFSFTNADTVLALTGDDASTAVNLPFPFSFYGQSYTTAHVSTNGFINFVGSDASYANGPIPSSLAPNGAIYPFWDDLLVDSAASVLTKAIGSTPNRQFVIEWRNVQFFSDLALRVRFEIILYEDGRIVMQYTDIGSDGREQGSSATIGIENATGTVALQHSNDSVALNTNTAMLYSRGTSGPTLPLNGSFEDDSNPADGKPDVWTTSNKFTRSSAIPALDGTYVGRLLATDNSGANTQQPVSLTAGTNYSFSCWTNIPTTSDSFTFKYQVQWKNASNSTISTWTVKTYSDDTAGAWNEAAGTKVAPAGTVSGIVKLVASSLAGPIYVDKCVLAPV